MSIGLEAILLDHSGGILLLVDPASLAIREVSKPTLGLLGYRREELLGRPITDIECSLADVFFWEEMLQGSSVGARNAEGSYLCASGDVLLATKTVSRVAGDGKAWLVVRAEPLDSGQRIEDQVASLASLLRATLEATADGILLIDRAGGIVNMNRRFSRIWGLPEELLIEHEDGAIFGFMAELFSDPDAYRAGLAAIAPDADGETFELLHLADGRFFERKSMPARHNAQIFGRVFSFTDITARKRVEHARAQLEVQLRESQKMEALGTLAGGIAHDFNNIVAAIMGNAELALEDVGPAHAALESLAEILKASRRAKDLVRQILAFGRRQVLERQVISLAPTVEESARLLRATLPAGVSLNVECTPDAPAVLADATQVEQVLLNLCSNAWQVVQRQGRPGVIEVRLEAHVAVGGAYKGPEQRSRGGRVALHPGRYARLTVRDNGPGMDEATRGRIFEPFFTTKAAGEGTGLGLAVVHGIVQGHEASIEVQSAPGEGTSFCVYFPAATAPVPVVPAHKPATVPERVGGKHILCVDDDESIVFLMRRLLGLQGYRVSGYTDPHEALAAVRAEPGQFDLAVTDYNMPGMSGLELARALREIRADLPVALASGYITEELRAEAPAAGVIELIYKPNTADELCEAVARLAHAPRGKENSS